MISSGRECPRCRSFWPLNFYRWYRRGCVVCAYMDPPDARALNRTYLELLEPR